MEKINFKVIENWTLSINLELDCNRNKRDAFFLCCDSWYPRSTSDHIFCLIWDCFSTFHNSLSNPIGVNAQENLMPFCAVRAHQGCSFSSKVVGSKGQAEKIRWNYRLNPIPESGPSRLGLGERGTSARVAETRNKARIGKVMAGPLLHHIC